MTGVTLSRAIYRGSPQGGGVIAASRSGGFYRGRGANYFAPSCRRRASTPRGFARGFHKCGYAITARHGYQFTGRNYQAGAPTTLHLPDMKRMLAWYPCRELVIAMGALLVSYGSHACFAADDGNVFLNDCSTADVTSLRGYCMGYITGVVESFSDVCSPRGSKRGQGQDVVVRYLQLARKQDTNQHRS